HRRAHRVVDFALVDREFEQMRQRLHLLCCAVPLLLTAGCSGFLGGGKHDAASTEISRSDRGGALPGEPESRELYLKLVQGLEDGGGDYAALASLPAYQAKYGSDPQAKLLLGNGLLAVGRAEEAATAYQDLLTTELKPAAFDGLGKVEASRNAWPAAVANFR